MNIFTNKKNGFTLIEVIISIMLIGVISIMFFAMFGSGMNGIIRSGKNSKNVFEAQAQMENNISNPHNITPNVSRTNGQSITLKNSASGKTYSVSGDIIVITYPYGNDSRMLTTFLSN